MFFIHALNGITGSRTKPHPVKTSPDINSPDIISPGENLTRIKPHPDITSPVY
jgi:hypothetical protein